MNNDAAVELVPYSSAWPALFAAEAAQLRTTLGVWLVAELEHIGSTAVPGLLAKPVIDIMAPIASLQGSLGAIEAAEAIGYCYYPYKAEQMHWFCKPSPEYRTHHLHLVEYESTLWRERLAFRNALRADRRLVAQYQRLKCQLAAEYHLDRDAYTEGKTSFVQSVVKGHTWK